MKSLLSLAVLAICLRPVHAEGPSSGGSDAQFSKALENARQEALSPSSSTQTLRRLMSRLEIELLQIQSASLRELAKRPFPGVVYKTRSRCGHPGPGGTCFSREYILTPVVVYEAAEMRKYHSQAIDSINKSLSISKSVMELLEEESGNPVYANREKEVFIEVRMGLGLVLLALADGGVRLAEIHGRYAGQIARMTGKVEVDPDQYKKLMEQTGKLIQSNYEAIEKARNQISEMSRAARQGVRTSTGTIVEPAPRPAKP